MPAFYFLRVFYDECFSIYKEKPERRHWHQNSPYQFQRAFEADQNCSGDSALPSGFFKLLISFFFVQVLNWRGVLIYRSSCRSKILVN